jgi:5-formyltetrahydrofolate cyclo-ligase
VQAHLEWETLRQQKDAHLLSLGHRTQPDSPIRRHLTTMLNKTQLRQYIITQRQQLNPQEQIQKSTQIFLHLSQHSWFKSATHVGCYLAHQAEVRTEDIIRLLWQQAKFCYLPVINPVKTDYTLRFYRYQPSSILEKNRYGIDQPVPNSGSSILVTDLDVLLVPLVGYDKVGNRLGLGGGFYDRALTFKKSRAKPVLLGLAYDLQQVDVLPADPWDIALDGIVTESGLLEFC